jgi:hypothetical protein
MSSHLSAERRHILIRRGNALKEKNAVPLTDPELQGRLDKPAQIVTINGKAGAAGVSSLVLFSRQ